MANEKTKIELPKWPRYFKGGRWDYWKIETKTCGHFVRNLKVGESYCFTSSDVKESEIESILKGRFENMVEIDERTYLEAVQEQAKRNSLILSLATEKLKEQKNGEVLF